jgi:hypothetical protein
MSMSPQAKLTLSGETLGSRSLQESKQRGALSGPRSAPDHDDDAAVRLISRETEEVIAAACHDDLLVVKGMIEHRRVRSSREST